MDDYAPIFREFTNALIIVSIAAFIMLVLVIVITVRVVKGSKAKGKDGKPTSPGLKAAIIVCYVILAALITSPFWIGATPIMDKLKEIV